MRLINLQEAIDQQVPFFVRDRKLKDTKANRKGGAILHGLPRLARNGSLVKPAGDGPHFCHVHRQRSLDGHVSVWPAPCRHHERRMLHEHGGQVRNSGNILLGDRESHHDQPNMKIAFKHYCRVCRLPMLPGICDTQCASSASTTRIFKQIIDQVQGMGQSSTWSSCSARSCSNFKAGIPQEKLCKVCGLLLTEDFAEGNHMANSWDPDKPSRDLR